MKKIFLLTLPLVALTFNACDKGDDNGGDETITGKLVKTIHYHNDENDDMVEFFYDSQRRITKIIETGIGEHRYDYDNNHITWFHPYYQTTRQYTLDKNGYVIKMEDDDYTEEYEYTNGYLSKLLSRNPGVAANTIYFTWENGNMTQITEGDDTYSYAYNDVENKLNINIFEVLKEDFPFFDEYNKFRGASPKNYPTNHEGGGIITYVFDSDGYPTEIVATTFYHYSETSTEVITITYY